jgi:hypothetical protein
VSITIQEAERKANLVMVSVMPNKKGPHIPEEGTLLVSVNQTAKGSEGLSRGWQFKY